MNTILLIEDDPGIGKALEFNLKDDGHHTFWAQNLIEAKSIKENHNIDLILLDIGLPDGSGLDFCKSLRDSGTKIPILILTATIEEETAVKSFEYGADDYIRKPFGTSEVLARIKRHLNIKKTRDVKINFHQITILPEKREALINNQKLQLNRREFDILKYFVENAEKVVSRNNLLDFLEMPTDVSDRTIDSHISHLRSIIKKSGLLDHKISSIYGVGYKLEKK